MLEFQRRPINNYNNVFFFSLKLQSVSTLQRALKALGATIDFDMLVNKFLLFVILV